MFISLLLLIPGVVFLVVTFLSLYQAGQDAKTRNTRNLVSAVSGLLSLIAVFAVSWGGADTQTGVVTVSWLILVSLTILALILQGMKLVDRVSDALFKSSS